MKKMGYSALFGLPAIFMATVLEAGSFEGYLTDAAGAVVRTPYGECIHTGYWSKDYAQPECDEILEVRSKYAVAVETAEAEGQPVPEKPAEILDYETKQIEEVQANATVEVGMPRASEVESATPQVSEFEVTDGGNLWDVSAEESVYGDPAMWPLLLCANRDQIVDADLIYAGQVLSILQEVSAEAREAAITHANQRGEWELGEVEDSDLEYLALYCN